MRFWSGKIQIYHNRNVFVIEKHQKAITTLWQKKINWTFEEYDTIHDATHWGDALHYDTTTKKLVY